MSATVEVHGLDELLARMKAFPQKLTESQAAVMSASLNAIWEKVPPYPQQPAGSSYRRTGTLGRSLGAGGNGEGGGTGGKPSIYRISKLGTGMVGTFGTNVKYAEYVIGENQAGMHSSNWWKLTDALNRAADKINRLWNDFANNLAAFLDGGK
jgi:hypothetical protein